MLLPPIPVHPIGFAAINRLLATLAAPVSSMKAGAGLKPAPTAYHSHRCYRNPKLETRKLGDPITGWKPVPLSPLPLETQ